MGTPPLSRDRPLRAALGLRRRRVLKPSTILRAALVFAAGLASLLAIEDPSTSRHVALAALAIAAWLVEIVPPFVPSLLLAAIAPLALEGVALRDALAWGADPLLALFFGGFALGASAAATGLDARMAQLLVRAAKGSARRLVLSVTVGGFVMSMWMSNAAAAGVLLAALGPLVMGDARLKTALLLAVAMGTNFGGMVTPIGSGPNAIAASHAARPLSFVEWMTLGLPLAALMVGLALALILRVARVEGPIGEARADALAPWTSRQKTLVVLFACAVLAWVGEPLIGVAATTTSLLLSAALFVTRVLEPRDLGRIDYSTLLLIAGGLIAGRLLERSGALEQLTRALPLAELPQVARALIGVALAATLSAVMSNTAAALLLIPVMSAFDPSPATPVLVAMGCAMGVPFSISTPSNAMAAGAGLEGRALLTVGGPLMIIGVIVVAVTGGWFVGR